MRYVTFAHGGRQRPGCVEGDRVMPIACESLIEYIALPVETRASRHLSESFALSDVSLAAPVRPHKNIFCVGRNYMEHAKEGARAAGRDLKLPDVPTFFTKAPTAIADPDQTLELSSAVSPEYDWEAELAIVIGARVKDVTAERALEAVFGYTCFNDITARDLQRKHLQWFKGKSLDNAAPMGPWIVSAGEIGDAQHLDITLRVNGEQKQHSNTAGMIFPLATIIAELSKGMTLEPGDVIATGTPEGVGFARTPPEFFKDGDSVEVEIENIGVLRNRIRII
jgi:2-keto-4-pentenoate hydratase/2-oxohepta-3-ene-1,7-dioic acid hydratase in catechol pathway